MKNIFILVAMLSIGAGAQASASLVGEWDLSSRACSSGTATSDGLKLDPDYISVKFSEDKSYELIRFVNGCTTIVKGKYNHKGSKITFMAMTSISCRDSSPRSMPETYSMALAHLSNTEMVLVATGAKALIACPEDDALILNYSKASQPGITRTGLQKQDISIPGKEVVQVRIDISPGVTAPRHRHPGEEAVYVIEGSLEYKLDGKAPVTLTAGQVLFIPNGVYHSAKNVGRTNAAELATYIVDKGKPIVEEAK